MNSIIDKNIKININKTFSSGIEELYGNSKVLILPNMKFEQLFNTSQVQNFNDLIEKTNTPHILQSNLNSGGYVCLDFVINKYPIKNEEVTNKLNQFIRLFYKLNGKNLWMRIGTDSWFEDNDDFDIVYSLNLDSIITSEKQFFKNSMKIFDYSTVRTKQNQLGEIKNCIISKETISSCCLCSYLNSLKLNKEMRGYYYSSFDLDFLGENDFENIIMGKFNYPVCYLEKVGPTYISINDVTIKGENVVEILVLKLIEKHLKKQLFDMLLGKPTPEEATIVLQDILNIFFDDCYNYKILQPTKIKNNKYIFYNGKRYDIVVNGEFLPKGYKLHIIDPFDRSELDKQERKMTPITVVLNVFNQIISLELNLNVN